MLIFKSGYFSIQINLQILLNPPVSACHIFVLSVIRQPQLGYEELLSVRDICMYITSRKSVMEHVFDLR